MWDSLKQQKSSSCCAENKATGMHKVTLMKWHLKQTRISNLFKWGYRKDFTWSSRFQEAQNLLWPNNFQFFTTVFGRGDHHQHRKSIGTVPDNNAAASKDQNSKFREDGSSGNGEKKWAKQQNHYWTASASIWHSKITRLFGSSTRPHENKQLKGYYRNKSPKETKGLYKKNEPEPQQPWRWFSQPLV